ncbi:type II secretion system protein [Salirhabdus sp. Marseille-P4669]|uniref:type II secretion system protein n=1 Tax=Salirhabdus sp. Marseille-P4669 TaxID=2042310 RepID=UPI000C7E0D35|nr:type II secretion system protein [Salirhabdus sp. Marseille-P4669]
MLRSNKGFTLLETTAAFSIFIIILTAIVPMMIQTHLERENIELRSDMLTELHNELLYAMNSKPISPLTKQLEINQTKAKIEIALTDNELEGCISWSNYKNKQERKCLYVAK